MEIVRKAINNLKTASLDDNQAKELLEIVTSEFPNMLHYSDTVNQAEIAKYNNIVSVLISDVELRKKLKIQQKK